MKHNLKKIGSAALATAMMGAVSMAHAAIDISSETESAKADIGKAGALIIGVVVAIAVIAWVRRAVK